MCVRAAEQLQSMSQGPVTYDWTSLAPKLTTVIGGHDVSHIVLHLENKQVDWSIFQVTCDGPNCVLLTLAALSRL